MICRIAFHDTVPGPIDDPKAQQFRAWIKAQPGFVAGWHAQDPEGGRAVSFTVWESEHHLAALRDQVPPGGPIGLRPVQMETFKYGVAF